MCFLYNFHPEHIYKRRGFIIKKEMRHIKKPVDKMLTTLLVIMILLALISLLICNYIASYQFNAWVDIAT